MPDDPNEPPWGPVGRVKAYGRIFQAVKYGSRRQRRAALIFVAVLAGPFVLAIVLLVTSAV